MRLVQSCLSAHVFIFLIFVTLVFGAVSSPAVDDDKYLESFLKGQLSQVAERYFQFYESLIPDFKAPFIKELQRTGHASYMHLVLALMPIYFDDYSVRFLFEHLTREDYYMFETSVKAIVSFSIQRNLLLDDSVNIEEYIKEVYIPLLTKKYEDELEWDEFNNVFWAYILFSTENDRKQKDSFKYLQSISKTDFMSSGKIIKYPLDIFNTEEGHLPKVNNNKSTLARLNPINILQRFKLNRKK